MDRVRVEELHFICPFETVPSVLEHGILSKSEQRKRFPAAASIANPDVQKRRAEKTIPGDGRLHSYANLYFDARNAMMSARRHLNDTLAVVRVAAEVLDLPDVIVTDRNAAASDVIFRPAATGIAALNADDVFAEWWAHSRDALQKRCAEVLVPKQVAPQYITGAYVRTEQCKVALAKLCPTSFAITVDLHRYF